MSDTPETDAAFQKGMNGKQVFEFAERLERERDEAQEALKHIGEYGTEEINAAIDLRQKLASALVERDEDQKELSSIYRWIERNHADGFIDSLTYLKNLERVTDSWYDRIDAIEKDARRFVRERDEARERAANWESSSDAMERAGAEQARRADENREWALRAERERDEARELLEAAQNALDAIHLEVGSWITKLKSK